MIEAFIGSKDLFKKITNMTKDSSIEIKVNSKKDYYNIQNTVKRAKRCNIEVGSKFDSKNNLIKIIPMNIKERLVPRVVPFVERLSESDIDNKIEHLKNLKEQILKERDKCISYTLSEVL